jgi:hypothetical protein
MRGIKLKYTQQEKDLINSSILEGNKMNEIIEKVIKISPTRTSDAVYHIVRKLRNQLKGENAITTKSMYFYTDEQIKTLKDAINSGEPLLRIAKKLHTSFNRTEHNLYVKLMKLKVTNKPVRTLATIRAKKELQDKKQQEVLQQPAELGVEVPHGMTFEGKPKRIMLHSDHFRIYF